MLLKQLKVRMLKRSHDSYLHIYKENQDEIQTYIDEHQDLVG